MTKKIVSIINILILYIINIHIYINNIDPDISKIVSPVYDYSYLNSPIHQLLQEDKDNDNAQLLLHNSSDGNVETTTNKNLIDLKNINYVRNNNSNNNSFQPVNKKKRFRIRKIFNNIFNRFN